MSDLGLREILYSKGFPQYFQSVFPFCISRLEFQTVFPVCCPRLHLQNVFPGCIFRLYLRTVFPVWFSRLYLRTVFPVRMSCVYFQAVSQDWFSCVFFQAVSQDWFSCVYFLCVFDSFLRGFIVKDSAGAGLPRGHGRREGRGEPEEDQTTQDVRVSMGTVNTDRVDVSSIL